MACNTNQVCHTIRGDASIDHSNIPLPSPACSIVTFITEYYYCYMYVYIGVYVLSMAVSVPVCASRLVVRRGIVGEDDGTVNSAERQLVGWQYNNGTWHRTCRG